MKTVYINNKNRNKSKQGDILPLTAPVVIGGANGNSEVRCIRNKNRINRKEFIFSEFNHWRTLPITHELVFNYTRSRFAGDFVYHNMIIHFREYLMDALIKKYPSLIKDFDDNYPNNRPGYSKTMQPVDILNINEIDLDGRAVLHSFVTLDYKLESKCPYLKSSLHMILQDAQKLVFHHGFVDETSIYVVNDPAAALRPCFMKYENKVFRKCDF